MGKRKEPEPSGGDAPAAAVKPAKGKKAAAAAAAAAAGEEVTPKPKRAKTTRPKKGAEQSPVPGGAAGPAADEEEEGPGDALTHERMRELMLKKKLEDAEKMRGLWDQFTDEQKARYEKYYSSWFRGKEIDQLTKEAAGLNVALHDDVKLVVSGLGKLFVGELVEGGRRVMAESGDDPAKGLRPHHLREALRRMNAGARLGTLGSGL